MDAATLERKISSLETSLVSLEIWLGIMTGLVVLGLFLEYWHEIPESIAELRKARRWLWKPMCIIVGAILITLGVAGELVVQSISSGKETDLRIANGGIFAALNKEAEDARKEAADAVLRSKELDLELAKLKAWRELTTEQRGRITQKLLTFKGTPFDLYVNPDPESVSLMNVIDAVLAISGWGRILPKNPGLVVAGKAAAYSFQGIGIEVPNDGKKFTAAASALVSALKSEGIDASLAVESSADTTPFVTNPGTLHIIVGSK
jgi:hypothetical protein